MYFQCSDTVVRGSRDIYRIIVMGGLLGIFCLNILSVSAQTIQRRGKGPARAPGPQTLTIRDSACSTIVSGNQVIYRPVQGERWTYEYESSKAQIQKQWEVDGAVRPANPEAPGPAPIVEKTVKFIPNGEQLFVKIEIVARANEEEGKEKVAVFPEVRFAGTYEVSVTEGTWPPPALKEEKVGKSAKKKAAAKAEVKGTGKAGTDPGSTSDDEKPKIVTKVQIVAKDQVRFAEELGKAVFSDEVISSHADGYRRSMLSMMEGKINAPGGTNPAEIALAGRLLAIVKAHPETFVVQVQPSYVSGPEIFVFDETGLRSSIEKETWTIKFFAHLPAIGR